MKSLRNILPMLCLVNLLLFMMLAQHWWLGALVGLLIGGAFYLTCLPAPAVPAMAAPQPSLPPAAAGLAAGLPIEPVMAAVPAGAVESTAPLAELVREVLPVWQGNVQLARAQTQSAIDGLTARFVGIHERLGGALDPARHSANGEILQTVQHAAEQLGAIASALEGMLASRQVLVTKFDSLMAANDEIRRLAQQNEQLAGQTGVTDLLSDEQSWQELAERSAENSRQIAARAKSARQQIMAAIGATGDAADTEGIAENSRAVIDQIIADFRHSAMKLTTTMETLEDEGREVDREVCDILVHLQFQDRISQILDHVQQDILRLRSAAAEARALPSPQQWLTDLEKTYTTQEQRQMHAGQQGHPAPPSQVDFF
ncbi:chemotaxis protein [Herbaspirillum huttiense]|uniref:chemotaxis protein n=2 Tax=Bacteria TaxID=2 RepID=UPI003877F97E